MLLFPPRKVFRIRVHNLKKVKRPQVQQLASILFLPSFCFSSLIFVVVLRFFSILVLHNFRVERHLQTSQYFPFIDDRTRDQRAEWCSGSLAAGESRVCSCCLLFCPQLGSAGPASVYPVVLSSESYSRYLEPSLLYFLTPMWI